MCRLLCVSSKNVFNASEHLNRFAEICKKSEEFQGHGWGCSYIKNGEWVHYKNINPIWEDDFLKFSDTDRMIAHARSAFMNKDIILENNMPFMKNELIFIFNGELHGVRLKSDGRTGAEKIFNLILRLNKNNLKDAINRSVQVINKRSKYIKAMNLIIADKNRTFISSLFNENPDYFTLWKKEDNDLKIVCSNPYPGEEGWIPISNNYIGEFK